MYQLLMTAITYGEEAVYLPLLEVAPLSLLKFFDKKGSNVAHYLAQSNCLAGIKWIHEKCPQFLTQQNTMGHTPHFIATKNNHSDIVNYLEKNNFKGPSLSLANYSIITGLNIEIIQQDDDLLNHAVKGELEKLKQKLNQQAFNRNKTKIIDAIITNQQVHCIDVLANFLGLDEFISILDSALIYYPKKRSNIALVRFIEMEYDNPGTVLNHIVDSWPDIADKNQQKKKVIEIAARNCGEKIIEEMYSYIHFENEKDTADFFGALFDHAAIREYQYPLKKDVSHLTSPDFIKPIIDVVVKLLATKSKILALVLANRLEMGDEATIQIVLLKLSVEQKNSLFKQEINDSADFNTLLHRALSLNSMQAAICMLDNGASLNSASRLGRTAENILDDLPVNSKMVKAIKDKEIRSILLRLLIYNKTLNLIESDYTFDDNRTKVLISSIKNLSGSSINGMNIINQIDAVEDLFALGQRGLEKNAGNVFFEKLFFVIQQLEEKNKFRNESCYVYMINIAIFLKNYDQALKYTGLLEKYLQFMMKNEDANKPLLLSQIAITRICLHVYQSFGLQMPESLREIIKKDIFSPNGIMIFPVIFLPTLDRVPISFEQLNTLNAFLEKQVNVPVINSVMKLESDPGFIGLSALCSQAAISSVYFWLTQLFKSMKIDGVSLKGSLQEIKVTEKNMDVVNLAIRLFYMKAIILDGLLSINEMLGHISPENQVETSLFKKINKEREEAAVQASHQIDISEILDIRPDVSKRKKKRKRKNNIKEPDAKKTVLSNKSKALVSAFIENEGAKKEKNELKEIEKEKEKQIDQLQSFNQAEWVKVGSRKTLTEDMLLTKKSSANYKEKKINSNNQFFKQSKLNYSLSLRYMSKHQVTHAPAEISLPLEIYNFMRSFKQSEIFLAGGFPRDKLVGRSFNDIDFVVIGRSVTDLLVMFSHQKYQAEVQGQGVNKSLKIKVGAYDVDLTSASDLRSVGKRNIIKILHENASQRDFTCNALFIGLEGTGGCLYDFYEGVRDLLEKKCLAPVPSNESGFVFSRYPLRLLRAMVLLNTLDVSFSKALQKQLEENKADVINALYSVPDTRFEEFYTKMTGLFGYEKTHASLMQYGLLKEAFAKRILVVCNEQQNKGLYRAAVKSLPVDDNNKNEEEATSLVSPKL